jgi:hypothetical protein
MSVEWILRNLQYRQAPTTDWTFQDWYYKEQGCWTSPLDTEEIAQLIRRKRIQPTDQLMEVWKNGERTKCAHREAAGVLPKLARAN